MRGPRRTPRARRRARRALACTAIQTSPIMAAFVQLCGPQPCTCHVEIDSDDSDDDTQQLTRRIIYAPGSSAPSRASGARS